MSRAWTIDRKRHELDDWLDRAETSAENRIALVDRFESTGAKGRAAFRLEFADDGRLLAFTDEKLLVKARKPDRL